MYSRHGAKKDCWFVMNIRKVSLFFILVLAGCASLLQESHVSVVEAQSLIRNGEVRWVVEPTTGCPSIYLHTGEMFCWEPSDYDLHSWVLSTNLSGQVEALIVE